MSNKNLLLGLLVAWLAGSAWWQKNKIENCSTSESTMSTDSLAIADSLALLNTAADSLVAESAAADTIALATLTASSATIGQYSVAFCFERANKHVPVDVTNPVAYMWLAIYGQATGVELDCAGFERL